MYHLIQSDSYTRCGKLSQWCLTCFVWVRLFSWTFDHWIGECGRAQSADQTLAVLSSSSFLSYSAPSSFSSDFLFSTTTHNCRSLLLMVLLRLTFFWKFKKNSCCWCDPEKVRDWILEHSTHFGMKQQRLSFHICEAARPGALQPNPKMKAGNMEIRSLGRNLGGVDVLARVGTLAKILRSVNQ